MELKAFQKIYTEAEEAVAEHRLLDVFSLTKAILEDIADHPFLKELEEAKQMYQLNLLNMIDMDEETRETVVNKMYYTAIEMLQFARQHWAAEHPLAPHTRMYQNILQFSIADLTSQLQRILSGNLGEKVYHESLDAVFGLLWHLKISDPNITKEIQSLDSFARRTLVGALMLGLLDCFDAEKLRLLLFLAETRKNDSPQQQDDMLARVMTTLTIVFMRYQAFIPYYEEEARQLHEFFNSEEVRQKIPVMMHAMLSQSLVDRVGKQVDDIIPIIRDAFKKQQLRLGASDDDDGGKEKGNKSDKKNDSEQVEIMNLFLDEESNDLLFNKLASHARKIDDMRKSALDVNYPSFIHLKRFPFFQPTAHWFYPFNLKVPAAQEGLTRRNGRLDLLTIHIMGENSFCSSDCYSYASMMKSLHSDHHDQAHEAFMDQIAELNDTFWTSYVYEDEEWKTENYFVDYCQSLARQFYNDSDGPDIPFSPFVTDKILRTFFFKAPSCQPFNVIEAFANEAAFKPSIDVMMHLGAYESALSLIGYVTEHFGTGTELMYSKGYALMQMQQWQRALSVFQQLLIMSESSEAELCMARCFEAVGNWEAALPLLQNEEQRHGESNTAEAANIFEETGRCLIQLQRWDEAVQRFFRLEFMERHLNVTRRAIAWCSIHQEKYERAVSYYRQLIDSKKATWEDHLNMGHALWLQGLTGEALSAYRSSMKRFNKSRKEQRQHFSHWSEAFQEDARGFLSKHKDATETALMLDAVSLP